MTWNLAVFNSNPATYKSPLYRKLHESHDIDVTVFYGGDYGAKFEHGVERDYQLPLREGYPNEVLRNYLSEEPGSLTYLTNPGLFTRIDGRFDALLLHAGYSNPSSLFALLAANLKGVPVLLHGTGHGNRPARYRPSLWKRMAKSMAVRSVLSWVDHIMADCSANRRYYQSFGVDANGVVVMPCAVDNERFRRAREALSEHDIQSLRTQIDIPRDDLVVLSVGQLVERKRPRDLLSAFSGLADLDASLVFVGEGPLLKELEATVDANSIDNVRFAGYVEQPDLPQYYELADCFALPSAYDPSPKVLNEAMNFELPIVTTDTVGTAPDLVAGNGAIVPVGNVDRLEGRLRAILTDEDRRERMGRRSIEIVNEWDFNADIKVIRDVLERMTNR